MAKPDPTLLDPSRYPFSIRTTTRFADVDPLNHINNVALAAALEDARYRFDMAAGYAQHMRDFRTMIVANYIDYVGEAHYPDPLDMHVGCAGIGSSSWTLACLATQQGRPCVFARATLVATDGGRPSPLPQAFRDALEARSI